METVMDEILDQLEKLAEKLEDLEYRIDEVSKNLKEKKNGKAN